MEFRRSLTLDPTIHYPPTRPTPDGRQHSHPSTLSDAKQTKLHPSKAGAENASLMLIGNATAVLKWEGIRLMTDPNFLNAGDHVHLGPDFTADIVKGPARTLDEPPAIDVVLLSHYHE